MRLIGVFDRPFDPVAESELARQHDGDVVHHEGVILLAQSVDDATVVVGRQLGLDVGLEAESLPEVGRWLVVQRGCHLLQSSVRARARERGHV